jgi:SAM-dependent methyltransferase
VAGSAGDVVVLLDTGWEDAGPGADVVVDWRNRTHPVVRDVAARLPYAADARRRETRAFFALRAPGWDRRFGDDDLPGYAAAVAAAGFPPGGVVADVGCGTGRALPPLRSAVGAEGAVLAFDLTPEMLLAAAPRAADGGAALVVADGDRLPLADATLDGVFAAGYLPHVPDAEAALRELARVTRPGGRLALFHPVTRTALATRQGRTLSPTDRMSERPLRAALTSSGWTPTSYEDTTHFEALATRTP